MVHNPQPHIDSQPPPLPFMLGQRLQQQGQQEQQQLPYRHFPFHARLPSSTASDYDFVSRSAMPLRLSRPAAPLSLHHSPANAHLAPPQLAEHGEHRLRRKTPNGTIDAGYDGNPTHLASGPPPFKHMILPASSKTGSYAASLQTDSRSSIHSIPPPADRWAYSPSLPFHPADPPSLLPFNSSMMPTGNPQHVNPHNIAAALALDCAPSGPVAAYQPYNTVPRVPTALQPLYQHSPGPALFHNGGVLPVDVWPEPNLSGYTYGLNHRASAHYNPYHPQVLHPHGPDRFVAPLSAMNLQPGYEPHSSSIQVPSQKLESLTLDSAGYKNNEPHTPGVPSPVRFREKVLTHAHRSYLELLGYLHQSKKSSHRYNGPRAASRMIILPKLPKASSYSSSVFASQHGHIESDYPGIRDASLPGTPHAKPQTSHVQFTNSYHLRGAKVESPASYHAFGNNDLRTLDSNRLARDRVPVTPLTSAKAAVEMLTNLCEQSDWKWIDGILLGGCLHYGLERYEQSLEWFQRIISLDSGYVPHPHLTVHSLILPVTVT